MNSIAFFADGDPRSWTRPGSSGVRRFTTPQDRAWRARVRHCAKAAACGLWNSRGWFMVSMSFGFADDGRVARCDSDNLVKAVLDACKGVLWHDDATVQLGPCPKGYSDAPGVHVEVVRVEAPRKTERMLEEERVRAEQARVERNAKARAKRRAA